MSLGERPLVCMLVGDAFELGGIQRLTWEIFEALSQELRPGRVAMASLTGPSDAADPRVGGVDYAGTHPLTLLAKARFTSWAMRKSLRWRSRTTMICMLVNQSQVAWGARLLGGSRYVVWAHGGEVWSEMGRLRGVALRRADFVLCSSEFTRRQVTGRCHVDPAKVAVLYPPVSNALLSRASRLTRSPGEASPVIVSVGRISRGSEYKGFDQVIRTLPHLAERVPDVRYVAVGGGDGIADLSRLAEEVGVADRVELPGALPDKDLWDVLEGARVFVLPSRMDTPVPSLAGEGFGIAYVEAAAFGRPVVGSTMGGAAEAVVNGTTGLAVDPTDTDSIARALLAYLEDPRKADRDGAAGRSRTLDMFTPERFAANLVSLLGEAGVLPSRPD